MLNTKFDAWCNAATAKIRYWRDRDAVSVELRAHLEDRYDALVANGATPEEATAKALESMGSAAEIAPQLGAIHRPWLGYLYSIVRLIGITAAVWAGILAFQTGIPVAFEWYTASGSDLVSHIYRAEDITHYDTPDVRTWVDGFHLRVTEVAVIPEDSMFHASQLHVAVEITYWPWAQGFGGEDFMWAVDSEGNHYHSYDLSAAEGTPRIAYVGGDTGGPGKTFRYFAIANFDCNAQWVELRYDRDGRDMVLRIDLTGGGEG